MPKPFILDLAIIDSAPARNSNATWWVQGHLHNNNKTIGRQPGELTLPVTSDALASPPDHIYDWVLTIHRLIHPQPHGGQSPQGIELAEAVGGVLFRALFNGQIRELYRIGRQLAGSENYLQIRLMIPKTLSAMPWEVLYDDSEGEFLVGSLRIVLARYPERVTKPTNLSSSGSLHLTAVLASPQQETLYPALAIAEHRLLLEQVFSSKVQQRVRLGIIEGANTFEKLQLRLEQVSGPHMLHIFCHGQLERLKIGLIFEDSNRQGLFIDARNVRALLGNSNVPFVLLCSCLGARVDINSASPPGWVNSRSLAEDFVADGVATVIAMPFLLDQKVANDLAQSLYQSFASGQPLDRSLTNARLQLYNARRDSLEWLIPVLFLRDNAEDGSLFTLAPAAEQPPSERTVVSDDLQHILTPAPAAEQALSERTIASDDLQYILKLSGFVFAEGAVSPFSKKAETEAAEPARISSTFVPRALVKQLGDRLVAADIRELLRPESFILASSGGSGKTMYRFEVERLARSERKSPALTGTFTRFSELEPGKLLPQQYMRIIIRQLTDNLASYRNNGKLWNQMMHATGPLEKLFALRGVVDLPLIPQNLKDMSHLNPAAQMQQYKLSGIAQDLAGWLAEITALALELGFSGVYFFIDRADEWPKTKNDVAYAIELLQPLLEAPAILRPSYPCSFKFFLPEEMAQLIHATIGALPIPSYGLRWDEAALKEMLELRFRYYGGASLDRLWDEDVTVDVESQLIRAAQGSPVKLLDLIEQIISRHVFVNASVTPFINRQTIVDVLSAEPPL